LKATESAETGWSVTYRVGATDVTTDITGAGYTTASLLPGGTAVLTVLMTPDGTAAGSTSRSATIGAFSDAADTVVRDSVKAVTTANVSRQPDMLVKRDGETDSAYAIDNEYQTTPTGAQVETLAVNPGVAAIYQAKVENDGNAARTYVLKATESGDTGWTVTYKVGTTDVTTDIKGAGYVTATLAPGDSEVITIEVTPGISVTGATTKSATVAAYLDDADTTIRDVVKAATTAEDYVQPDALIKKSSEADSAYAIDGSLTTPSGYQTTPSGDQIEAQSVTPNVTATYNVRIQNDGNTTRTFSVKASQSSQTGWNVAYKAGMADVTAAVTGGGYTTKSLGKGESETLTLEMTPDATAGGGVTKTATVAVYRDGSDAQIRDVVQAETTVGATHQPDALIKSSTDPDSAYAIDGSATNPSGYQTTPLGDQIESSSVNPNVTATYHVRIQNDGNVTRTFLLTASESTEQGWTVIYKVGETDVTSGIRGSGYTTLTVSPAESVIVAVQMTPGPLAVGGETKSATLAVALSSSESAVRDAVKAATTLNVIKRPDALIKNGSEGDSAYAINNAYQAAPDGDQIKTQTLDSGGKVVYHVKVENDGNTARTFLVKAVESTESGWTVTYKVGDVNVSDAVRAAGYTTSTLAPGSSAVIAVEMTAGASVRGNTSKSATASVYLDGADTTVRDAVKAVASVNIVIQADALVKKSAEADSAYALNNVYQSIPAGDQVEAQSASVNDTATYQVKIENDGNISRTFLVRAGESDESGWTLAYKVGTTDVASDIRGSGYTTATLEPAATTVITVSAKPGATVGGGSSKTTTLNVYLNGSDATVRDTVRCTTSVISVDRPDALIKKSSETDVAYAIDNIYQTTPDGQQIESQSVNVYETAGYNVKIQNDGNVTRTFVLKSGETVASGWIVTYKVDTKDVTTSMRGAGYTTANLAPGASEVVTVTMMPGATVLGGSSNSATIGVYLDGADITVRDSVRATTTLIEINQPDTLIKTSGEPESAFAANGTPYETTPTGDQIEIQSVLAGVTAQFHIRVENDGNTQRSFTLKAVESTEAGWTVVYIWDPDNITAQITGAGGFTTPVLKPGENHIITVNMTSASTLVPGSTKSTKITAEGGGKDAVMAGVRVSSANRPDAFIKKCSEPDTAFQQDNVYQTTPTGDQVEQQNTVRTVGACYQVKVQNDDTVERGFNLRAEESSEAGWTVIYRQGTTDIGSQMRATEGYTIAALPAGGSTVISVEMVPDATVAFGTSKGVVVKAYNDRLDQTVRDSVRATTTVINAVAPTVTNITPSSAVNTGSVSITDLAGTGFENGATVRLTRTGETDVVATDVAVVGSTKISCKIDLTGKTTGTWNVVVRNPVGLEGTLKDGFTVTAPPAKDLALTSFTAVPNPARRRKTVTFNATIKNIGVSAVSGATFRIVSNGKVLQGPVSIPTIPPGESVSGTLNMRIPRTTAPGDYLVTGEIVLSGDTNANNSQTINITVTK